MSSTKEKEIWREQLERLMRIPRPTRIVSPPETATRSSEQQNDTKKTLTNGKLQTYKQHVAPAALARQLRSRNISTSQSQKSFDSSNGGKHSNLQQSSILSQSVPECLNTFSDFFSPEVSVNDKFELYMKELSRQERASNIEQIVKDKIRRSDHRYYGHIGTNGTPWNILPDIPKSGRSHGVISSSSKNCSPVDDGRGGFVITTTKQFSTTR